MKIRRSKNKIFKILFVILLFIASIIGMVFGSINIGKNNEQKGLFGDNYHVSYSIDLSKQTDANKKNEVIKQVSDAYSSWLISKNINVGSIQYTVDKNDQNRGIIQTELLNIERTVDEFDKDKKHPQNPDLVALNSISTSRVDIQQYDPTKDNDKNYIPTTLESYAQSQSAFSSVITSDDLNISTAKKDHREKLATNKSNKNFGVEIELKDVRNPLKISRFNKDKLDSAAEGQKLQWIVFNDIDVLVMKLNYAKWLKYALEKTDVSVEKFNELDKKFKSLSSDLQEWAKKSFANKNSDIITKDNILAYYKRSSEESTQNIPNANSNLKSIVEQYIVGTITYDNYNDWFPNSTVIGNAENGDNNDNNNNNNNNNGNNGNNESKPSFYEIEPRVNGVETETWISFQNSTSEQTQKELLNKFKKMTFTVPLKLPTKGAISDSTFRSELGMSSFINESNLLRNQVTKLNAYDATMLSLGVAMLLVAIILIILYRIPGFFGGFATIASGIFSLSLLILLKINFSLSTVIGLIVGIVCVATSVTIFMERMRKSLKDKYSVFDSVFISIRKSLLSIVDVNLIVLLFGLASVFIGKSEIVDFGLVLILVSVISLASVFLFFVLPYYFVIDNMGIWKPQLHAYINMNKIKHLSVEKVQSFNNKYIKILIPLFATLSGIVLIVAISLVATIGVKNSSVYNDGTIVYITSQQPIVNENILNALGNGWFYKWTKYFEGESKYITAISSAKLVDFNYVNGIIGSLIGPQGNISLSVTSPLYFIDLAQSGILSILVGYAFMCIYAIFRLNFFSIFPVFISSIVGILMPISMVYIFWLPIDSLFIYAMLFVAIISSMVNFVYISVTKTRFNKRQISEPRELINFVSFNMYYGKNTISIMLLSILVISTVFFIFGSLSMVLLFLYIVLLSILSIISTYLIIPILYFGSLFVRQKYVRNILTNIDTRMNTSLKEVDEELIDGINKFR